MKKQLQSYFIICVLVVLGAGAALYKNIGLGFPLLPGATEEAWTVEAKITFVGDGGTAKVILNLPDDTRYLRVLNSQPLASGYGHSLLTTKKETVSVWSRRQAEGRQTIYYKAEIFRRKGDASRKDIGTDIPDKPDTPEMDELPLKAATEIVELARERSSDDLTFVLETIGIFRENRMPDNVEILRSLAKNAVSRSEIARKVLAIGGIPSRIIKGIFLGDGQRKSKLDHILAVYVDNRWVAIDPKGTKLGMPRNFLPWQVTLDQLLVVEGGKKSKISFSVIRNERAARNLATYLGSVDNSPLVDFSIYALPIEQQNTFKLLLLIPIGALVVVIMRNLVGVRTSGTFMPILIALAFEQTTLAVGLVLFITVVSMGLVIRSYLAHLNLLLVPRISAVLIVVILIYIMISVMGEKLDIQLGQAVTFFPMIIVSWTIERMSVLWDEDGPKEVCIQGGGSLLVAVLAYLMMSNIYVSHITFLFPELLLVVLAVILVIGRYTGYRLSELRRFEPMAHR